MAHELNNPLSIIATYAEIALQSMRKTPARETIDFLSKPFLLEDVEKALHRAWKRRKESLENGGLVKPDARPDTRPPPATTTTFAKNRLEDFETDHILSVLQRHRGHRGRAARDLGISLRTLYYRISQYKARGIEIDDETP